MNKQTRDSLLRALSAVLDGYGVQDENLLADLVSTVVRLQKPNIAVIPMSGKAVGSRFAKPTPKAKEMPDELEHALDCNDDHDFVADCHRQWLEKGWLSPRQLEALGKWKTKEDLFDD